jgi:hypothetical protein
MANLGDLKNIFVFNKTIQNNYSQHLFAPKTSKGTKLFGKDCNYCSELLSLNT